MIKSLTLENFKAFGKPTRIELAPITLVFGENSAGKSSILQALNLLKQESTLKASLKGKRKRAGWDNDYLLKALSQ